MNNSNTITKLQDQAKATLYNQAKIVSDLAKSGSDAFNMEATILSGMIEMTGALNLLSQDEISDVIKKANSEREE